MRKLALIAFLLAINASLIAFTYDYLDSSSADGSATTSGSDVWSDVVSTTLDVTDVNKVLVMASIDMWASGGGTNDRIAKYKLDCNNVESGELFRLLQNSDGIDHGLGSLVHIFDVSSTSGIITIKLRHSDTGGGQKDVESRAVIVAIALTTEINNINFNNANVQITTDVSTSIATFAGVTSLSTGAVSLPLQGDFYIAASIGSSASRSGPLGEWILQYSTDEITWTSTGHAIQQYMSSRDDYGMVSLVALEENLAADDYYFRVAHRMVSGPNNTSVTTTSGSGIVAVALNYINGSDNGFLPSFSNSNTTGDINSSSSYELLTDKSFTSSNDINSAEPDVLIHAQFNMEGNDTMLSGYKYEISGATSMSSIIQQRCIGDNTDTGSGVLIGLGEDLTGGSSHTVSLSHAISDFTSGDQLTTNNILLAGFQLFIDDLDNPLPVTLSSFTVQFLEYYPVLCWTTQSESNNLGWNIYRSEAAELESAMQINPSLILGAGTTSAHTEYIFIDEFSTNYNTRYNYWIECIDFTGFTETYGPITLLIPEYQWEDENSPTMMEFYGLSQNYPNPFNPETDISLKMKRSCTGELAIYNVRGQKIKTLFSERVIPQDEMITYHWNGKDQSGKIVAAGIYYSILSTSRDTYICKMLMMK